MNTHRSRRVVVANLVLMLTAIFPASAHHQFLRQAFPGARSHSQSIAEVRLVFNGKADAFFSAMRLLGADGSLIAEMTQPKASNQMVLPTPALPPGHYLLDTERSHLTVML